MNKIPVILMIALAVNCSAQSLSLPNNRSWVNIGDLDIQGNQITVEALIYIDGNNSINVVSKHVSPSDVNYLLRPHTFELTTYVSGNSGTTRFLQMFNPFKLSQNKWYHIAGTYNGSMVRYYVDGCLVVEQPFSGNLFQNNFMAAIGNQSNCQCEQFFGNIDEVRIWNVCRTQDEIRDNMFDLPNPNLQKGLVAYYKMDNSLINHQGNPKWNGIPVGVVQYSNAPPNIQPFKINNLEISNTDCEGMKNGSIVVSTNRPNSQYSINNNTFQSSGVFSNLGNGSLNLIAKSPEGCIIDTTVSIGFNKLYNLENRFEIICQGESYLGYSAPGIYIDTLDADVGCDTIRKIDLKVLANLASSIQISICQGESYEGYSRSGTYTDVFTSVNGCDSTRTLILTVLPIPTSNIRVSICQGESYQGYSKSGTYTDVFPSANGCDSTRTLILTVLPILTSNISVSICQGESYQGYSKSGTYSDIFKTANRCDSTRTLNLKVYDTHITTQNISICQGTSYNFNGLKISSEGTFIDTLKTTFGCDSIISLRVKVNAVRSQFLGNDTILCNRVEYVMESPSSSTLWFDGDISKSKRVSSTGFYVASILDSNGCEITDSVYVQFNIKSFVPNVFSPNDDRINDCFIPYFSKEAAITRYVLSIFDRWGNLVFTSLSESDCWDGRNRGKECPAGVYVYLIDFFTEYCGRTVIKGDLTLIR